MQMDLDSLNLLLESPALPHSFYGRAPELVAPDLLNCLLIHDLPEGVTIGRISETEAYGDNDPSCHAFRGKTPRNAVMFGPAGRAYVYFTYGMHFCLNAVTDDVDIPGAVLIRAVEPLIGLELMAERRGINLPQVEASLEISRSGRLSRALCGGPGKLCQAFAIGRKENGADLEHSSLRICAPIVQTSAQTIVQSPRIGIREAADWPWRFTLQGDAHTSRQQDVKRS